MAPSFPTPKIGLTTLAAAKIDIYMMPILATRYNNYTTQAPRRVRIPHKIDLNHAEGITPIRQDGFNGILIVFDDGNAFKRKGGHYLLLSYDQLKIDAEVNLQLSAAK